MRLSYLGRAGQALLAGATLAACSSTNGDPALVHARPSAPPAPLSSNLQTPFPAETPLPQDVAYAVHCGEIPFPGLMLYGVYDTTGCWAMIRRGSHIDLSGGHERGDQEQGILLVVREVDGQPATEVLHTPPRDGATHIYSGTGDYICFSTAHHPSTAQVFNLDENAYGTSREAATVCARPRAEPWPSHAP